MKSAAGQMLDVVLCWHMHQPDYRLHGEYLRPWTWLHAIKDYSDMAAHLEQCPGARCVVNFSPLLILQLQDYARRIHGFLTTGAAIGDRVLDALAGTPDQPLADAAEVELMQSLLRAHETRMRARFPAYARLCERASAVLHDRQTLPRAERDDLLVWYVLVWLGESLRQVPLVQELQQRAGGFSAADRRALLHLLAESIGGLLPRYCALAASGQVELSVSPYSHPILPLLLDHESAREAWPDVTLPERAYPGGAQRCDWQMSAAIAVFEATFGLRPAGCWPSEGGVSEATLALLAKHGFSWVASGAQVLRNSLGQADGLAQLSLWQLRTPGGGAPVCFFRDDELSDRIGFEYSGWQAEAAVDDLVQRLEGRLHDWHNGPDRQHTPVLSIIMDGENAWEYYSGNGAAFLQGLYRRLSQHPRIRMTTFSAAQSRVPARELPRLLAGTWVYGTFSTWIGDPGKNRAWDLLAQAKAAVDAALEHEPQSLPADSEAPDWIQRIHHQLAVCEASDWFWWLGADNQLEDGPAFDHLFRQQLAALYALIGMAPPAVLGQPISHPHAAAAKPDPAAVGAMRPATKRTAE